MGSLDYRRVRWILGAVRWIIGRFVGFLGSSLDYWGSSLDLQPGAKSRPMDTPIVKIPECGQGNREHKNSQFVN